MTIVHNNLLKINDDLDRSSNTPTKRNGKERVTLIALI
jgi:hypothetical protein